jgi:peptidoglycan/xylan/chitin deacetylase (PgdA/CDA1 family)
MRDFGRFFRPPGRLALDGRAMRALWAIAGAGLPVLISIGASVALPTDAAPADAPRPSIGVDDIERDVPPSFGPSVDPVVLGATMPRSSPAEVERSLEPEPEPEPEPAREIFYGDTTRRRVALTFDDGPSRENTPRILDVLAAHDVHVTFFVLGNRVDKMPDLVARIDDEGHEIGNHTWSHPSMRSLWPSALREELESTNARVAEITGKRPTLVRPPFGRYPPSALPVFAELGLDAVLWSVDSLDWDAEDPQVIAARVVRRATPGSIILLHDRTSATVKALPEIIRGLRQRGFEIVPVSSML